MRKLLEDIQLSLTGCVKLNWQTYIQNKSGWMDLKKYIWWLIKTSTGIWGLANSPKRRDFVLSDFCVSPSPWCSQICGANMVKQLYTYYTVMCVIVVIYF